MFGGAVGFDSLGEHRHDVFGGDAPGDVVGDALLGVLVDEHQGPEAAPARREVRHEVPCPNVARIGGLRGYPTSGVPAARAPRLLLGDAEAEDTTYPAELPEADRR